ncbi:phosphatase PAP2 family protein [Saccharibacter sp. 17.LH.SD]|uniref:acid phosphatase n=1 Tax=Saccharibacter sp. 17.LH.SD TaxID=2689393 RepID=UPI00136978C6|nr:phosphatase PAP2 family protein [Saccharibacter sp. 17.LH.SD]MXV43531.1 phosphatase PAP2 family protein [Saccharibacter sp. 17.LH.SD]
MSKEGQRDVSLFYATRIFRGTPRWKLALHDAQKGSDALADDFSCAAGFKINTASTQSVVALIHYVKHGVRKGVSYEKHLWKRERPYVNHPGPICLPETERALLGWSYPSGHAAAGYATALTLASLLPERREALLKRGHLFGESRVICGVHWNSDILAGEEVARAYIKHEQTDPHFQALLKAAKVDLATHRRELVPPDSAECVRETKIR